MKKLLTILSLSIIVLITSCKKEAELVTPPTTTTQPPIGDTTDTNQVIINDYKIIVEVTDNAAQSRLWGQVGSYVSDNDTVNGPNYVPNQFFYDYSNTLLSQSYTHVEYLFQVEEGTPAYVLYYLNSNSSGQNGWSPDLADFIDVYIYKNGVLIHYRHGVYGKTDMAPTHFDLL